MKKFVALLLTTVLSFSGVSTSFADVANMIEETTTTEKANVNLAADKILAFPGAEGAGKYTTGGRGGKVYHVTNLNDSGAGSFRDAVGGSNRIVVFDVGGTIELKSDVVVKSNITIAGQTAPGGKGITLKNYKLGLGGENAIVRYVSSRPGERGTNADYDALGGANGSNSILDHCSFGWANDEQWGLYSNNTNYTLQYSIVGPANSFSYHSKGIHGFGGMFGKGQGSWHHNLIAHNISRNFRGKVEGTSIMDYVNNVVYDWGYQTTYGTAGRINYANNFFKAGNSTSGAYKYFTFSSGSNVEKYKFYLTGNKMYKADGSLYNDTNNNWKLVDYGNVTSTYGYDEAYYRTDKHMPITVDGEDLSVVSNMDTAEVAFDKVTKFAGAGISQNCKPKIDVEVCNDAINGTGYISGGRPLEEASSSQQEQIKKNSIHFMNYNEYYPEAVLEKEIVDSDNDGMPDEWEIERGLNPNNASDATGDYLGQGYNNIEYYINDLTIDSFPEGVVTLSPKLGSDLTVDSSATEVEGETYKTISKALEYIKNNAESSTIGAKNLYIAPGVYNEDLTVDMSNVKFMQKENTTGDIIIKNITLTKNANEFDATNITFGDGSIDSPLTVSSDKAMFTNCTVNGKDLAVSIKDKARTYFNKCKLNGTISADSRTVINNSDISAKTAVAKSTLASDDKYGLLFINSSINANNSAVLADCGGDYGQVVYYNCKISNATSARYTDVTGKTDKIRFMECETKDANGIAIDLSKVLPSYAKSLDTYDYYETYNPYNHLKAKYGEKEDAWNPGSFDTVTPQAKLQELADSISIQKSMIVKNTPVTTSFDSDADVKVSWSCSDSSSFADNTIIVGEYGSGVKTVSLTATISKAGLKDIVKEYTVLIGSLSGDASNVIDFEECAIGGDSEKFAMTANYEKNDKITWGVVEELNGQTVDGRGKFYQIKQSSATAVDETVDAGKGIYDFTYNFGKCGDKVIEVSFDVFLDEVTEDGYFEAYLRGSNTLGQIRFTSDAIEAYKSSEKNDRQVLTTDLSKWYTFKMVVDSTGLSNGTSPKIDYYIYDQNGKKISSCLNASPAKAFDATATDKYVPDRLVFRPNRNYDVCEFYVDNIQFKDLTDVATADAEALSTKYTMNVGDKLPVYGNHLSNITWKVVDGDSAVVNADGTINYDKCGVTALKVRGVVTNGDNLKATVETADILLVVNGTGENQEVVYDKFFSDTEDFSGWYKEYNQSTVGIDTANKDAVYGNSSTKIKLPNKAVFKKFNTPVNSGKVTFTTDFLTDSSGRTFRIFLENAETADDGAGYGTAAFASENIFYHLTDIGGVTKVITSDSPSAKDTTTQDSVDLGTLEPNKWYRIKLDLDFDAKTVVTSAYLHGTDGTYNVDNISATPVGTVTSNLISKTPLELKQIRLLRTAAGNVYFDNVSVSGETKITSVTISADSLELEAGETSQLLAIVSPSDALNKNVTWSSSDEKVATVDKNGLVTAVGNGSTTIKVVTEDGNFSAECKVVVSAVSTESSTESTTESSTETSTEETTEAQPTLVKGDIDGNGSVEVKDAELTLEYVLDKKAGNLTKDAIDRMKVSNDEITAEDAASILKKALNPDFIFEVDKK